ncbi:MAG: hypothetical protein WBI00_04200, partial [Thermoanaerobaculia bacterium]
LLVREDGDPSRHLSFRFVPGQPWEGLTAVQDDEAGPLVEFIKDRQPSGRLDWNDLQKGRDRYWDFRKLHDDAS